MSIPIAAAVNLLIIDVFPLICFRRKLRLAWRRAWPVITVCAITILVGGCATSYEPRPDLTSVDTIGVVLPEESSETLEAEDVLQLYNLTKGEDRVRNSAVGAGTGAGVGLAAGAAAGAIFGCTAASGFLVQLCFGVFMAGGAILGGTTGAVAGATVDTQEQVEVAPLHLYEVNKVLPALQRDYLTRSDLGERVLRILREQNPTINFLPAVPNGDRYSLGRTAQSGGPYTDVNLVLSELSVLFAGKAENDPRVTLTVQTQWTLTKYDASTNLNSTWDILAGSYVSKKHPLSEWLADEGALLKTQVNEGLEDSLNSAFSDLVDDTEEEKWTGFPADDSF